MARFVFAVLTVLVYALGAKAEEADVDSRFAAMQSRIEQLEARLAAQSEDLAAAKKAAAPRAMPDVAADASSAAEPEKPSAAGAWLGASQFSGFVSASYLYNFNRSDKAAGRSFDVNHNEFALNKLKLTLERPLDSTTSWGVGYRADLIFGQDAKLIQSAGLDLGDHGDVEQLYVNVNVPVGNGLQVSVGKSVTLMGVEVIEETANPNWSEGNQFLFVENFTSTGIQLSYKWTDKIDTQFRVSNGWDVVKDNNSGLSYMGRIGFAPDDKTSISLVGFGGPEEAGNSSAWRKGFNLVASRKLTDKLTVWGQADYGTEDASAELAAATGNPALASRDAAWWATGVWVSYDFSDYFGVAVRGDYFGDEDGARTSGAPFTAPFAANTRQKLGSLTLTLNIKPVEHLEIRPEFRWDHSSADLFSNRTGNSRENQFTFAIGMAYSL